MKILVYLGLTAFGIWFACALTYLWLGCVAGITIFIFTANRKKV